MNHVKTPFIHNLLHTSEFFTNHEVDFINNYIFSLTHTEFGMPGNNKNRIYES